MDSPYTDLIEQIREKCRQQRWYGPDLSSPAYIQQLNGHGNGHFWHDSQGNSHQINLDTDLNQFFIPQDFLYQPATKKQLRQTERMLGFPLDLCLQEIYTNLANGGFGPGYGISGILGGYHNGRLGPMVKRFVESRTYRTFLSPEHYLPLNRDDDDIEFPLGFAPAQWLELCHWGCAIYSYLDNSTGCVYRLASCASDGWSRYRCEATSLEAWMRRWISGTLSFDERT